MFTYNNKNIIEPILYSIPQSFHKMFIKMFEDMLEFFEKNPDNEESIENMLYEYVDKYGIKYEDTNSLDVSGNDAIEGLLNIV